MNSQIKVSGNIIGELSEKIPSNIIALNELIKNSYDAGAGKVTVKLDSLNRKLIIKDTGSGMDKKDIDTLFHISQSEKKYGILNQYKRLTQGSKGLGFLSVFKFGNYVTWKTKKDNGMQFSVNYNDLISSDDISQYQVDIIENDNLDKGTEIEIELSEYNSESLLKYFSEEKYYEKIINSFDDKGFIIELQIDQNYYSNQNSLELKEHLPERQLYHVKYHSEKQKINYYHNNTLIHSVPHKFNSNLYKLDIELIIYSLKTGYKSKITKLFYNPHNDLTPLIYINSNLFNNYDMFEPNILKNIKTGSVLNQIIGYIKIVSSNSMISFNSDRSQFLQNELTDNIKDFLREINIKIQTEGSKYKKYLVDFDFLELDELTEDYQNSNEEKLRSVIHDDFEFKKKVKIKKEGNKVTYSIFGKSKEIYISQKKGEESHGTEQPKTSPAVLKLKQREKRIPIPSAQIDLSKEIQIAIDSKGNSIYLSDIEIKVDDVLYENWILESITVSCTKKIQYSFCDPTTGMVVEEMLLVFYQPEAKVNTSKIDEFLITIPTNKNYNVNYNPYINNLVNQLNKLVFNEYQEAIACSLRSIFEISVDTILKVSKFPNLFQNINKLEDRVTRIIQYIVNDNKYLSEVSKQTSIDFNSLKNMLNPNDFNKAIQKAHLGAHKSRTYLSEPDIKELGKKAGLFVVIINEMISNPSIV